PLMIALNIAPIRPGSPSVAVPAVSGRGLLGVEDVVAVSLFGEEPLAVLREVLIDGVAGDQRVEAGGVIALLRPQQPAEPLGLLLPRAEGPGDLDGHRGLGQVDG